MNLLLRTIKTTDAKEISFAFKEQGWNKPASQYRQYFEDHRNGKRDVIIAEVDDAFAGYVTIMWQSNYDQFSIKDIPEIVDLNVLQKFQRRGIGTQLLDEAERRIFERSNTVGIGVGLTSDYGIAQQIYIKRGYIPDGRGLIVGTRKARYGDFVTIDDSVVLYMTKKRQ